jgi:hypothetical protein
MQRFKIEYADGIKEIFSNLEKFHTQNMKDELRNFLEQLQSTGDIPRFNLTYLPGIDIRSGVREVYGDHLRLTYTFDGQSMSVKIWSCHILSVFEKDEWENKFRTLDKIADDLPVYVTQVDDPDKIISAVKFIDTVPKSPFEIAHKLGHKGQQRSVERHGQYLGRIICELGLGRTVKHGRGSKYELTKSGCCIATAKNLAIEERVMIEAMLGYKPMQLLYGEIIEDQPFSLQFVKDLIDKKLCPHDHTDITSKRRAQALRSWAIWFCERTGTPVHHEGSDGKQLFIPYIYADQTI